MRRKRMKTKVRTKMINIKRTYSISRMHSVCKFTIPDLLQLDIKDLAVLEVNLVVVIILSVINNITSSGSQFQLHKQHLAL